MGDEDALKHGSAEEFATDAGPVRQNASWVSEVALPRVSEGLGGVECSQVGPETNGNRTDFYLLRKTSDYHLMLYCVIILVGGY